MTALQTRHLTIVFLSLLFLPTLQSRSLAWGPVGHRTVAMIAEDLLDPEAHPEGLDPETLRTLRALHQSLGLNAQTLKAAKEIIGQNAGLAAISNCADILRKNAVICGGAFEVPVMPETGPWHYINIPHDDPVRSGDSLGDYCSVNPNDDPEGCVTGQIHRQIRVLSGAEAGDKRQALMFLVHFVGDAHQPLHCSDDDDAGGNRKPVAFEGKKTNLHALWDGLIGNKATAHESPAEALDIEAAENAGALTRRLERDMASQDVGAWIAGAIVDEAGIESFLFAQGTLRPDYAAAQRDSNGAVVYGADYQDRMQPEAFRRLQQAGARLAYILNKALSPKSTPRTFPRPPAPPAQPGPRSSAQGAAATQSDSTLLRSFLSPNSLTCPVPMWDGRP
ncbi:MAG: hypothetical protein HY611_07120 [Elusimicrobia bacterium]|nr:hypothetical protein [Elusimicrobiota bacterium]